MKAVDDEFDFNNSKTVDYGSNKTSYNSETKLKQVVNYTSSSDSTKIKTKYIISKNGKIVDTIHSKNKNGFAYITSDSIYFNEDEKVISADSIIFNKNNNTGLVIGHYRDSIKESPFNNPCNPLYILDGKEISKKEMENLRRESIKSVNVFNDAEAIVKYGGKGKNGVVIIESKKDLETEFKVGHRINSTKNQSEFIISGKVTLDNGIDLEKTNVIIEEKQRGALTNSKGSYKIKVSIGDKITFSHKGLASQVVTVNNKNDINVKLSSQNGLSIDASNPKKPIHYIFGKKVSKKEFSKKLDSIMKHGKTSTKTINNTSTVSGTITNEKGKPIQGATVLNGASAGVMTNAAGKYVIKAAKGDKLIYSYKNMASQNIEIKENKTIDVKLIKRKN